jgi:hypothetical protein
MKLNNLYIYILFFHPSFVANFLSLPFNFPKIAGELNTIFKNTHNEKKTTPRLSLLLPV